MCGINRIRASGVVQAIMNNSSEGIATFFYGAAGDAVELVTEKISYVIGRPARSAYHFSLNYLFLNQFRAMGGKVAPSITNAKTERFGDWDY